MMERKNLIFLDETGFNQHAQRTYVYSQRNTKAYVQVLGNRGVDNSCTCATGSDIIIGYEIIKGAYNSE